MQSSRVLAIDPGFDRMGVAILTQDSNKPILLHSECITTNSKESLDKRLLVIGKRLQEVIAEWSPESLAIETLFFNQNTTSAMGVAQARGVVLYSASSAGLNVFEYSPQAVKIAVTGYGKADKIQIESMVRKLITIASTKMKMLDDELDAIAVGITHLATQKRI